MNAATGAALVVTMPWKSPPLRAADSIEFGVLGEPASKSRARFTGRGNKTRAYTPAKTRQAEEQIAAAYLAVTHRLNTSDHQTAFAVHAEFHLSKHQRRDVDNMLKLVLDGLNSVAWADDSQVVEVHASKFYDMDVACTLVCVEPRGEVPRSVSVCVYCGNEFPRPPSHWAKKHCSLACRQAQNRETRTKTCAQCGGAFVSPKPKSEQRFCSKECHYASKQVAATCARCGTAFTKPRHLNRSGNSYCSPECKATYWRERRKSAALGTCQDCGGPTTKKTYKRCQDCHFAAGGRWAE